jgi:predicted deacylase
MPVSKAFRLGRIEIPPGVRKDIRLKIGELIIASPVYIPVTVAHGTEPGPAVFVTAALHGDELNGVEMIRQIRANLDPTRVRGTILLVMIANPISFVLQKRDLPDGRDLNRSFPGRSLGSIASAIAHDLFHKVVVQCQFGIDLHTAGRGRINLPHVRANLKVPKVRELAFAFGPEIIIDQPGEAGMLRVESKKRGIAVITYEAGEPMKFENDVIERGVQGIWNALSSLGAYPYERRAPAFQLVVDHHKWVRSKRGGILILHVKPGDIVRKGQVVAHTSRPFGTEQVNIHAPFSGVVISVTTVPTVLPGGAVCHISRLDGMKLDLIGRLIKGNHASEKGA